MASRAFLHVGTMKSATTYLQGLCNENVATLAELGVLWQGSGLNFGALKDLDAADTDPNHEPTLWNDFRSAVETHVGTALVSNELLAATGRRRITGILAGFNDIPVHVIVTARDLGRVLPSQWQERARNRRMESWPDFMERLMADHGRADPEAHWFWRRQDLTRIIEKYAGLVGSEEITVVTVPPSGSPPNLLAERFFSVLGITDLPALTQPATDNPSMGTRSVELVRRIQERLTDDDRARLRLALKYALSRRVLASRHGYEPAVELTGPQLSWAGEVAELQIKGLAESGVKIAGDLADLRPRETAPARPSDPRPATDEELLDLAVDAMIGLVDALDELARTPRNDSPSDALRLLARSGGAGDEADG